MQRTEKRRRWNSTQHIRVSAAARLWGIAKKATRHSGTSKKPITWIASSFVFFALGDLSQPERCPASLVITSTKLRRDLTTCLNEAWFVARMGVGTRLLAPDDCALPHWLDAKAPSSCRASCP